MRNTFWRFAARACWKLGMERLGLRLLLRSLDDANYEVVTIDVTNWPDGRMPVIVFEDSELMANLDSRQVNVVRYPLSRNDIN